MTKRIDPDIKALSAACRALNGSSSGRMLRANMEFLWDRYVRHPTESVLKMPWEVGTVPRGEREKEGQ